MRTSRRRLGLFTAAVLAAATVESAAWAHPPTASRRLLVESRPDGRWVVIHLSLSGMHRHTALELAAGPRLSAGDEPLVRALGPRALEGIELSDAEGAIDLSRGKSAAKRGRDRVELMFLIALGERGRGGLDVVLKDGAEPLEVQVVGAGRPRVLKSGQRVHLRSSRPEPSK